MTRYELLDRIGVGGMAEIFRGKAVAAGGFEKPVAIKRILPHLSQDKRFVELLIAEAKVLSLLKHRNIVQIYDVGLGDDAQYFLVMEYVDGKDLGAVQRSLEARRTRIPFDLALHIAGEICEALEHAHSARAPDGRSMSLVHRDVSPSNVLMSRAGEVKLTDFGIAKRAEQEATGHGAVRGKFAYISPEQARNEPVEPRSDVFSVGILLWELVTGRRLFSGLGDMEALRSVREATIPRPREVDGRLSPEIDALIASALARDPRSRPTAGQLGQQLRSIRYSLDVTVGDPATELAKAIDAAEAAERAPRPALRPEFEMSEATVIRIHTADEFSLGDKDGAGVARARLVIDRFEEEETRLAQLSRDQMAFLRDHAVRESGELTSAIEPPMPRRSRRSLDDEGEVATPKRGSAPAMTPSSVVTPVAASPVAGRRAPVALPPEDAPTFLPGSAFPDDQVDDPDEATRLLAPASLAAPERGERSARSAPRPRRPSTQPPPAEPIGARRPTQGPPLHDVTPSPHTPPPGTVHNRAIPQLPSSHPAPPSAQSLQPRPVPVLRQPSPMAAPPPPMPPPLVQAPPPVMMAPQAPPPVMMAPPQAPPPASYAPWAGMAPPRPGAGDPYPGAPRPSSAAIARPRRALKPWMLVIGAIVMALLAFAITRAFIHR